MNLELIEEQLQLEQNNHVYMALTDLEKCYDTVWREGLILILHSYGIKGNMLRNIPKWISGTIATPKCGA